MDTLTDPICHIVHSKSTALAHMCTPTQCGDPLTAMCVCCVVDFCSCYLIPYKLMYILHCFCTIYIIYVYCYICFSCFFVYVAKSSDSLTLSSLYIQYLLLILNISVAADQLNIFSCGTSQRFARSVESSIEDKHHNLCRTMVKIVGVDSSKRYMLCS